MSYETVVAAHWLATDRLLKRPVAGKRDDQLKRLCGGGDESLVSDGMLGFLKVSGVSNVLNDASEIGRLYVGSSRKNV